MKYPYHVYISLIDHTAERVIIKDKFLKPVAPAGFALFKVCNSITELRKYEKYEADSRGVGI